MKRIIFAIFLIFALCLNVYANGLYNIEENTIISNNVNDDVVSSTSNSTASVKLLLKNSSGTYISGTVQLYLSNGAYAQYNIPTNGLTITNLVLNSKYGFNISSSGYATYTAYSLTPTIADRYTVTFTLHSNSSFPDFSNALTSYTAPSQSSNQHFGWRNNGGLDYHTGVDMAQTSNGTSFGSMNPAPTAFSVCDGTIVRRNFVSGAGNVVQIAYSENSSTTYYVSYLHLSSYSCGSVDTEISSGDAVGVVGNTLYSSDTGDDNMAVHLHISVSRSNDLSKTSNQFKDPKAFGIY